jgi:hypothetical protein
MASLLDLVIVSANAGIELKRCVARGTDLSANRQNLVAQARESGADHLLFLDADQTFPADGLLRLLARGKDVIGCNYRRRFPPHEPTANVGGEVVATSKERALGSPIEEANWLGLGFCLVRLSALPNDGEPLFVNGLNRDGSTWSEDSFFFARLRAAGVKVYLDNEVSLEVGHIAETVVWN